MSWTSHHPPFCFIHEGRPKAGAELAMTGAGGDSLNANAPHAQPSSPANAGEPVFQSVGDGADGARLTGSPPSRGRRNERSFSLNPPARGSGRGLLRGARGGRG